MTAYAVRALTHYQTYPKRRPRADLPPQKVCNLGPMAPRSRKKRQLPADAARDDFEVASAQSRRARTRQALDSGEQAALAEELIHYSEEVKRTRNRERYVTRTLLGYEDSAEARAERAEAEVAALRERNGKLEGENKVLREHSERLFAMLEARPKQ